MRHFCRNVRDVRATCASIWRISRRCMHILNSNFRFWLNSKISNICLTFFGRSLLIFLHFGGKYKMKKTGFFQKHCAHKTLSKCPWRHGIDSNFFSGCWKTSQVSGTQKDFDQISFKKFPRDQFLKSASKRARRKIYVATCAPKIGLQMVWTGRKSTLVFS